MIPYPASMMGFIDMFPTDAACLEYLRLVRWPDGYRCPRCAACDYWCTARGIFICKSCSYETSVIAGTLFEGTHKPLRFWFQAMWYVVSQKNGVSALGLQKALDLGSYHTAWVWLHKLRRAMVCPDRDKLSGTIEVDETWVGGVRSNKNKRNDKSLVFIAVEVVPTGIGRIRMSVIEDTRGASLVQAVKTTVDQGSTVRSDGCDGYNGISNSGYNYEQTPHKQALLGDATPFAHQVAALFKRWWLGTHQGAISAQYLPYYLDEFTFRFNRRTSKSRGKLFLRLMEGAVHIGPMPKKILKHNM
jgi:transposase-like protein